jgi:hypothetical protein
MKNGKISTTQNLKKILQILDVVQSNRYLTVITLIINWLLWLIIKMNNKIKNSNKKAVAF